MDFLTKHLVKSKIETSNLHSCFTLYNIYLKLIAFKAFTFADKAGLARQLQTRKIEFAVHQYEE